MKDLFLAEPDEKYQKSFEHYVLAYKTIHDDHYIAKYQKALVNFQAYVTALRGCAKGTGLPEGAVETSTFWLIDEPEVVGVVRIRHREAGSAGHIGYDISPDYRNRGYGSRLLKLALEKALEIGIEEVIITCNTGNIASKRIIEKNGGKYLSTIFDEEENEYLYRFSITL
ncbi:MAG: GNAT family N-acetyltransferase [Christensenellales bacterium]